MALPSLSPSSCLFSFFLFCWFRVAVDVLCTPPPPSLLGLPSAIEDAILKERKRERERPNCIFDPWTFILSSSFSCCTAAAAYSSLPPPPLPTPTNCVTVVDELAAATMVAAAAAAAEET